MTQPETDENKTMSADTPMVIFGEDWGGHPSSTQHLARELSKFHEITWVNSIGMRSPKLSVDDFARVVAKGWRMIKPSPKFTPEEANHQNPLNKKSPTDWQPTVVDPVAIPFHGNKGVRWLNEKLIKQRLYSAQNSLAQQKPILWLSLPSAVPLLGQVNECFTIYYCGDDFSALEGVDHDVIGKLERELVEKADLILAASETLLNKFPQEKTLFIPHGVADYFFEAPGKRPDDLPDGPVAGFYGSISSWLDQEMLLATAQNLPHWNFVLIGQVRCDVSRLRSAPNIHFLGEKTHQQLPDYVHHWQVSLLPFKDNAQIQACNPLKLREYMAVGKPIVATDFPALEPYRKWIKVSSPSDTDGFSELIQQAAADIPLVDQLVLDKAGLNLFDVITDWSDIQRMQSHSCRRKEQVTDQSWRARALLVEHEIMRRLYGVESGGDACAIV